MIIKSVVILTLTLLLISTAKAEDVNKKCVADFKEMQELSKTPERTISEDQWPFINAAYAKAESLFIDDSFYSRMENLGEKGIIVALCDDDSGYEQGNCFEYYFKKGSESHHGTVAAILVGVRKEWHIGEAVIEYVCEGYKKQSNN